MDIKIPFLGDGIDSANVASILVEPGEDVTIDQTLIELETDKATAPVPSLYSGKVEKILVGEGDLVKEGMLVVVLEGSETASHSSDDSKNEPVQTAPIQSTPKPTTNQQVQMPVNLPNQSYELSVDLDQDYLKDRRKLHQPHVLNMF